MAQNTQQSKRGKRGFQPASSALETRVRQAGQKRGFALSRLLTHWPEVAGPQIADIATPVEIKYGREGGFGATLTVLTKGAHAPMLEMQTPALLKRLNACYGYPAISRIRITQTASTGFGEAQAPYGAPRPTAAATKPNPKAARQARDMTENIADAPLRDALERLAHNVLSRGKP